MDEMHSFSEFPLSTPSWVVKRQKERIKSSLTKFPEMIDGKSSSFSSHSHCVVGIHFIRPLLFSSSPCESWLPFGDFTLVHLSHAREIKNCRGHSLEESLSKRRKTRSFLRFVALIIIRARCSYFPTTRNIFFFFPFPFSFPHPPVKLNWSEGEGEGLAEFTLSIPLLPYHHNHHIALLLLLRPSSTAGVPFFLHFNHRVAVDYPPRPFNHFHFFLSKSLGRSSGFRGGSRGKSVSAQQRCRWTEELHGQWTVNCRMQRNSDNHHRRCGPPPKEMRVTMVTRRLGLSEALGEGSNILH